MDQKPHLNVADFEPRSHAAGPGARCVLWLQGCPILCPGCVNDTFLPIGTGTDVPVSQIFERIMAVDDIEGVTFSGGEPTMQARALTHLCELLASSGLTLVCYSGYTIESLRRRTDPWIDRLLTYVDVLIDGPYVAARAASLPWRGSANQRVHFLSPAYRHLEPELEHSPAQVDISVDREGFLMTGTWPEGFLDALQRNLHRGRRVVD